MGIQKPRYQDLYGSEYMAPEDLPREGLRVQFVKWDMRQLHCANAKQAWKVVLWAKTSDGKIVKKMVAVNKTSAKQLAKAWGKPIAGQNEDDYSPWLGKTADLTHVRIKAFGSLKDAVLITPLVKPVEGEIYEEENGEEVIEVPHDVKPIRRPQQRTAPSQQAAVNETLNNSSPAPTAPANSAPPNAQEEKQSAPETVDHDTGEVHEPVDEPLEDELVVLSVEFKDGKKQDGTPYRVYFIKCSDERTYTSFRDEDGQNAQLAKDEKRGVLITAEAAKKNKAGKEYYPIIELR